MISSADFTVSLLGAVGASAPLTAPQEGPQPRDAARQTESCRADLMTVSGQFSCPPPGSFMAVSGQFVVSAVRPARSPARPSPDASAPSSRPTTSPGSKPTDAYASYSPNSRPSPWRSSRQNCDQRPAPKGPTPDRDEKHRPPRPVCLRGLTPGGGGDAGV